METFLTPGTALISSGSRSLKLTVILPEAPLRMWKVLERRTLVVARHLHQEQAHLICLRIPGHTAWESNPKRQGGMRTRCPTNPSGDLAPTQCSLSHADDIYGGKYLQRLAEDFVLCVVRVRVCHPGTV
jgi:hypothetical protein